MLKKYFIASLLCLSLISSQAHAFFDEILIGGLALDAVRVINIKNQAIQRLELLGLLPDLEVLNDIAKDVTPNTIVYDRKLVLTQGIWQPLGSYNDYLQEVNNLKNLKNTSLRSNRDYLEARYQSKYGTQNPMHIHIFEHYNA